ncbi:hypothetical protein K457DRAFT_1531554 [Linnemannia elongata AG-77]|uniref:Uncharacterized protein n=1 Tax=Linnemannia elongata AG-77 TaxID=1314771 RepID=A0A197JN85_9FUNG|nr:hypothetical protein K457DRAFT_1531554 [Linnemannia elongata AG-77]
MHHFLFFPSLPPSLSLSLSLSLFGPLYPFLLCVAYLFFYRSSLFLALFLSLALLSCVSVSRQSVASKKIVSAPCAWLLVPSFPHFFSFPLPLSCSMFKRLHRYLLGYGSITEIMKQKYSTYTHIYHAAELWQ